MTYYTMETINHDLLYKIVSCCGSDSKVSEIAAEILSSKYVLTYKRNYRTRKRHPVWYTTQWIKTKRDTVVSDVKRALKDHFQTVIKLIEDEQQKMNNDQHSAFGWMHAIDITSTLRRLRQILVRLQLKRYPAYVTSEMEDYFPVRDFDPDD